MFKREDLDLWLHALSKGKKGIPVPGYPGVRSTACDSSDYLSFDIYFYKKVKNQHIGAIVRITTDAIATGLVKELIVSMVDDAMRAMKEKEQVILYGRILPNEFNPSCRMLPEDV